MYRPVPGRYVMVPSPGEPFQAFVPATRSGVQLSSLCAPAQRRAGFWQDVGRQVWVMSHFVFLQAI